MKDSARHYISTRNYDEAVRFLLLSHQRVLMSHPEQSLETVRSLNNLGYGYLVSSRYDSARIYISRADSLLKTFADDDHFFYSFIYLYMGKLYLGQGDYILARDYLNRSIHVLNQYPTEDNLWQMVEVNSTLGKLEREMKNYNMSEAYYRRNEKIVEKMGWEYQKVLNLILMAWTVSESGDIQRSIEIQQKAINICRNDSAKLAGHLSTLYNNMAMDYIALGHLNEAEDFLMLSKQINNLLDASSTSKISLFDSYGQLYDNLGRYEKSIEFYQRVLENLSVQTKVQDLLWNPSCEEISDKLTAMGTLQRKSHAWMDSFLLSQEFSALEQAIIAADTALMLIDHLQNSYQTHENKLIFAKQAAAVFWQALYLNHMAWDASGDPEYAHKAFGISEKSKSSVLLSHLRDIKARTFAGIPPNLLTREKNLAMQIALHKEWIYEEKLLPEPDSENINRWQRRLFDLNRDHNQLLKQFEKEYPEYYRLKYQNTVASVHDVQQTIDRNTTLIEYVLHDTLINTFIITRNSFHIVTRKIDSSFYQLIREYLAVFQNFDFSRQTYSSFTDMVYNSCKIYDLLIGDNLSHIKGNKLIIVPDGILSYLPFETLITEMPNKMPSGYYRDLHYLILDYAVSYAYSSTHYTEVAGKQSRKRRQQLLAFAPEYASNFNVSNYLERSTRQHFRNNLHPIPGVKEEIEALSRMIETRSYIGAEANESNFLEQAPDYDLLHLAMHTVIDNRNPMYSKLIFSVDGDSLNDGLLNTYEIFGLRFRANMVVLSACSTGEGDYSGGEGVMSLARGFVYAGSPSLVMTLWEVEDKSGVRLMTRFYGNLMRGMDKSSALRQAKIDFIQQAKPENTHPFFWSSYVVLGNTRPISYSFLWYLGIAAGMVILTGFIVFRYRRRRKQT